LATNTSKLSISEFLILGLPFYGIAWWISNRKIGRLGFKLSLPCFVAGFISAKLISLLPLPFALALGGETVSFLTGIAGFYYLFIYDMPKMKSQKEANSTIRRAERVLDTGLLLIIGAYGTDVSLAVARLFQGSLLLSIIVSVILVLGVALISSGVIIARRSYSN